MSDDYRSDLSAAQTHIARLQEEVRELKRVDAGDLSQLEAERTKLALSLKRGKLVFVSLGLTSLSVFLGLPALLSHDFRTIASVGLPPFVLALVILSLVVHLTSRSETKKRIALTDRLLAETRRRLELEERLGRGVDASNVTHVRVEDVVSTETSHEPATAVEELSPPSPRRAASRT